MILVSLGTQDREFKRLLEAIEREIIRGNIKEKVIVQSGETKFVSDHMEIFDLIPSKEFLKLLEECRILICHGGVGTIIDGLQRHKKIIAAARLKEFGEHQNNHQKQIIHEFTEKKLILELDDFDKLDEKLKEMETFTPGTYESNTPFFIHTLDQYMENVLSKNEGKFHRTFMQYLFYGFFAFFIEWLLFFLNSFFSPIVLLLNNFIVISIYQKLIHFYFFRNVTISWKREMLFIFLWLVPCLFVWYFPQWFQTYFLFKMFGFIFGRFLILFFLSYFFHLSDLE